MARKNVFGLAESDASTTVENEPPFANSRPLAGFEKPLKRASPVGAISQSLGGINEKAQRVDELERRLALGQAIVELDPAVVDSSFVVDRLGVSAEEQEMLVSQIRDHGQQVPILVRPHPDREGRFQVAYGHRRLAAIRKIGGTVRAVVRDLTDEQLVVSQGQENNARTDLTFIERSFFASRLEERNFSRDVIMSALGVDKAALSRMIALVDRLPSELIEAIGAAPGFGRTRWAELADLIDEKSKKARALKAILEPGFSDMKSDERFQAVYDQLRKSRDKARSTVWRTEAGRKAVRISETSDTLKLAFDKMIEPEFGAFVETRLSALYQDFVRAKETTGTGD
ncbi:plasmid partitioning protein RepB [Rhizobium herbae]|uniref:ParB family chromosome partitioning protein n=1 Tax=Rhizobium herbae TaxID=508661 RepID=A0ABS4ERR6_9HYPH|nr:plasmid partitioning protein RepB [Rhizobium herbae]MBP1860639.1 ParB family chromosome partitioning protein [Rhizobium herbae]